MSKWVQELGNQPIWTLRGRGRIWAAKQAWNLKQQPRRPGPHVPMVLSPPSPWHSSQGWAPCWFLLIHLHYGPPLLWTSSLDLELCFRISLSGWARAAWRGFLDAAWLPVITPPCLSVAPVLPSCPARTQHRRGLNDDWICLFGYSPSPAHLPSPRYQTGLPNRPCIVLEEGLALAQICG